MPIPLRQLLPWAIFGVLLALVLIYFVGAEEGAASLVPVIEPLDPIS